VLAEARGKHVLVLGYGKSACDVTVPVSEVAATTHVIARHRPPAGHPFTPSDVMPSVARHER
jgi:cation diffusion facilitator CzcD-associated flavoprotein CzcO